MYSVMAIFKSSVFLYYNRQVHRDFLITLYIFMMFSAPNIVAIFHTVIAFDTLKTVAKRCTRIRGIFMLCDETGNQRIT